jgi:hypothetical protein
VTAFIDGARSVLDIYQAVRAECGHLVVGDGDSKFVYLLSPDAPDILLESVMAAIRTAERNGVIELVRRPAAPEAARKK